MHVEVLPPVGLHSGPHLFEVFSTRERRENREPRLVEFETFNEIPEAAKVFLAPVGIDHEVAGDAVSEPPGDVDPFAPSGRLSHP